VLNEPRTVQSFTFTVDGVMYSAAANRPTTRAELSHDGDRYTIKGTAQSFDVEPPLLKEFTASVTCKSAG
jgi:lipoprotein LpqH